MRARGILVSKGRAEIVEVEVDDPGRDEVLIETKACGICMEEVYIYRGLLPGGRVVGHEGVGTVVKIGEDMKNVDVGDMVTTLGGPAFAEYYKTKGCNVARIPSDIDDFTL